MQVGWQSLMGATGEDSLLKASFSQKLLTKSKNWEEDAGGLRNRHIADI